ncbi:MAG: hypothetical protein AB4426_23140 [Xenococcaceae cyanobacterium]
MKSGEVESLIVEGEEFEPVGGQGYTTKTEVGFVKAPNCNGWELFSAYEDFVSLNEALSNMHYAIP